MFGSKNECFKCRTPKPSGGGAGGYGAGGYGGGGGSYGGELVLCVLMLGFEFTLCIPVESDERAAAEGLQPRATRSSFGPRTPFPL